MTNTPNAPALNAIAELLLWMGEDRAADAIYAVMEGATLNSIPQRPALKLVHTVD